jgi:hypothetical protein
VHRRLPPRFFRSSGKHILLDFFPFPSNEEPAQKIELLVECDDVEALCIILAL